MTRRSYAGNTQPTTLASPITNIDTSLTVVSGTNYPDGSAGPAILTLDAGATAEEKVLYTARTGNVFSGLTRGFDGTTAASHSAGAGVRHSFSALDANEANAHINDTTLDQHTQYGLFKKGLAAVIGAAGRAGKMYYKTDLDYLTYDDGSAFHDFQSKAVADAAYPLRSETQSAKIAASESTTNTTFGDLATPGPAVTATIGASGRALVIVTAQTNSDTAGGGADMSFAVSGATTVAANANSGLRVLSATAGAFVRASHTYMQTGLTPGSNTFTAKYAKNGPGGGFFTAREITVIPL